MLIGLRKKFVAAIMLVATLFMIVLLTFVYSFTAASMEAENIRIMQSVGAELGHGPFRPDAGTPNDRLHYFVLRVTLGGDLVVMGNTSFDLSDSVLLTQLYSAAAQSGREVGVLEDYSLRFCVVDRSIVFADISEELGALRNLRNGCILIGLAALLVLQLLTQVLVRWMIRPVDVAWKQQRQFVADASHELKTPLTVILTNAELLGSEAYTDEDKRRFAGNILTMSQRMRQLVEGLLDLARVDNGVVHGAMCRLDYSRLVENDLLPFEPLYFESGRMLESDIEPGILLRGSPTHLSQVTGILLDNAMKYSPQGGTIRLTLKRQGSSALLCVDSPGTPIPAEERERIFQRFYTLDKARTDGSSYGLGLPIADGIVREHKGRIWTEPAEGRNRFYVKLPM